MKQNEKKYNGKKLAIIGASYLQLPLIEKAKQLGIETHVFAWKCGDVGEVAADYFYPISITEKEEILKKCKQIDIDGICTIASDLAVITTNFVSEKMNLTGNSIDSSLCCTNKYQMRKKLSSKECPCPKFMCVNVDYLKKKNDSLDYLKKKINSSNIKMPVIVKPTDRSGSRGITKVKELDDNLLSAVYSACNEGFNDEVIIEEFIDGKEYSVECLSYQGCHQMLAITEKFTTGSPHFIETGHLEPAQLSDKIRVKTQRTIYKCLDALGIVNGASHSEIKISEKGDVNIIEIGARMGGDFIGSHLVELSTGCDFLKAVVDVSLGYKPSISVDNKGNSAVIYVLSEEDLNLYRKVLKNSPHLIVRTDIAENMMKKSKNMSKVTDSSSRHGYYILFDKENERILKLLKIDNKV